MRLQLSKKFGSLIAVMVTIAGVGFATSMVYVQDELDEITRILPTKILDQIRLQAILLGDVSRLRAELETYQQSGTKADAEELRKTAEDLARVANDLEDVRHYSSLEPDERFKLGQLLDDSRTFVGEIEKILKSGPKGDHVVYELKLDYMFSLASYALDTLAKERVESLQAQKRQIAEMRLYLVLGILIVTLFTAFLLILIVRDRRVQELLEERVSERTRELAQKNKQLEQTIRDFNAVQEKAQMQERMAFLGSLTAGIAHELKNPLNFIKNFSEVSSEQIEDLKEHGGDTVNEEVQAELDGLLVNNQKITEHSKRASEIITSMQMHARQPTQDLEEFDFNAMVDQAVQLSVHGLKAKNADFSVEVQTEFDEACQKVMANQQDLSRVMLNIVDNACYAAQQKQKLNPEHKPKVKIKTSCKQEPSQIEVTVWDNGTGMPEEHRTRVFEPFFTSKPSGEGTGLGLSMSYDIIVNRYGGELDIFSEEGEFTEFVIVLPT